MPVSLEEKLRRVAGGIGLLVSSITLTIFVSGLLGFRWANLFPPDEPSLRPIAALSLALGGVSLWLQTRTSFIRAGLICAAGLLVLSAERVAEEIAGANWVDVMWAPLRAGTESLHMKSHASLAIGAVGLALLGLRQRHGRSRWPISAWISCAVMAMAAATLLEYASRKAAHPARPIEFGLDGAAALLLLGAGILLARPEDRHIRILFAPSATGSLARRLFAGVAVTPMLGAGLMVALLRFNLFGPADGVFLLAIGLALGGFALALFTIDTAVGLDDQREGAEQARLLLTAQLQEQAAQLQETVSQRTRELHEANLSLRTTADSHARLALVAHHTTNGVVITDAEGRVEWVNSAFERQTGYTLKEMLGQKPGTFLQGPGTDPATVKELHDARVRGEPCKIEILNYAKDGRTFWQVADIQPVRDRDGQVINFISIQMDVTEHKAAAERQRALTQRLKLATRAAALGVWEWDATTGKSHWDERTLEIYGVTREEFEGTTGDWSRRLHPEDAERALATARRALAETDEYEQEFRILRASDGALRHVQSRCIVQRDQDGRPLRVTGTERDVSDDREAIEEMEALNERLRLALRSSQFGVWELDAATNRLVWDDRMFEIYQVSRGDFDGSRDIWRGCLHPDDRAKVYELTRQTIAGERPNYDTEFRIVRADGSVRHIEAHGYLQRDAAGQAVRLVGLNRDITADHQLQAALDFAEQRWQLAIEGTDDSVWDWNIETGIIFHDLRWARMLGYEPGEIGETIDDWKRLAHPDDLAANEAALQEHFAQRSPVYRHELRMKAKSGEWKWINDRGKVVSRAADGRPLRMAGTHTDNTARRQLEERLRQVEELAEQVSRLALIGGWEIDLETSQLTWSAGLRRIHEVDESFQPTFTAMLTYYPPEARETFRTALREARINGTDIDLELPLLTARGRQIWVRVLGKAEMAQGRAVRLHGAIQDITAQHDGEDARRQLEVQLFQAQKMETLGTLAGGIAHDFNNLLTGIIGYHELAADSVPPDHPAHLCLAEARNASLRARELVEQILTFGRQSTNVEYGPLDLVLVLEEARRFLRATLPAMINIQLSVAPNCSHVLGDATQIHQVLLNLGSNASHAMGQGGTLNIELAPVTIDDELALALGGIAPGAYLCLAISDTGHGMDEATRRRIFDPFFTTKNSREGTGLGLAVVHGIVRAHHGAIAVESSPGAGSTFRIYLPSAVTENERAKANPGAAPRGGGQSVCVVDDEEIVGSCTKLVLESRGYRTTIFTSAEQCLKAMANPEFRCSLLLTDQTMPGMQGTDLAATLRKQRPKLPVVIMSGYFSKISPAALDELGHVELLAKPFTTDELSRAVHSALHPAEVRG